MRAIAHVGGNDLTNQIAIRTNKVFVVVDGPTDYVGEYTTQGAYVRNNRWIDPPD